MSGCGRDLGVDVVGLCSEMRGDQRSHPPSCRRVSQPGECWVGGVLLEVLLSLHVNRGAEEVVSTQGTQGCVLMSCVPLVAVCRWTDPPTPIKAPPRDMKV